MRAGPDVSIWRAAFRFLGGELANFGREQRFAEGLRPGNGHRLTAKHIRAGCRGLCPHSPLSIPCRGVAGGHAQGQGELVVGAEGALPQSLSSAWGAPAPPHKGQNSLQIQLRRCKASSRDACAFMVSGDALPVPASTFSPTVAGQARCWSFGAGSPPRTLLEGNPTSPTNPAPLPYAGV